MVATAQLSTERVVGQRIASLDSLRAISIATVILGHASTGKGFPHIPLIGSYSAFRVRVFFVISVFLITTLLIKEHDRSGTISLREFYRRRGIEPLIIISLCNLGIAILIDHCIRKEYRLLNWTPAVWLGTIPIAFICGSNHS